MSKTKKNNKSRNIRNARSMKGKKGTVGAPAKHVNWPTSPFTIEALSNRNKNQCVLSLRKKVDAGVADGSLIQLKPLKQRGGGVGRPKARFVTKDKFDAARMEKVTATATVTVTETPAAVPAPAPVTPEPVAAIPSQPEVTAAPAPVMTETATETVTPAPSAEVPPQA